MAITQNDGSIILSTKVDTNGLKKGFSTIKGMASAVGASFLAIGAAVATATVAITKMSVSAYADYEQLVGGVETLFKGSADKVKKYAENAFYTSGVSANEYMRQVTSFSASLISSLAGDTEKAAEIANTALIDISDNANKMGSTIESVTLAFQGFAKQQYMLLNNLKLGYGGTKTEMERLLKDAEAYMAAQGKAVQYNIDNLGDVYTAINVIQNKLGIAGTTALEAEKTIAGSANMTKAAWQDVLSAIAGGGDLDKAINNLVFSISKLFENMVPVVERALNGIGALISQVAPLLVQTVAKSLINSIPMLLASVYKMIIGIAKGIKEGIASLLTGKTSEVTAQLNQEMSQTSENTENASDNMSSLAKNTKKAGKEAKKSLANFDDISILADKTAELSENIEDVDLSGMTSDTDGGLFGNIEMPGIDTTKIESDLATVMMIAGGALAALGIVLICYGAIPMGIGLIIAGAASFGVGAYNVATGQVSEEVSNTLTAILAIVGTFLLVIGIVLICTGAGIGIGIALIVAALASYGSTVALNWNFIKEKVTNIFEEIYQNSLTQAGMIVLGMILLCTGNLPVGLALLATAFSAITSNNKEDIVETVKTTWDAIQQLWDGVIQPKIDKIVSYVSEKYNEYIKPILDDFKDKAQEIWDKFLKKFLTEDLPPAIDKLKDSLQNFKENVLDPLFDKVDEFVTDVLKPMFDWIVENLAPLFEITLSNALVVFEAALSVAGDTIVYIIEQATNLVDLITALAQGDWETAWGKLGDIVKEEANFMINCFETALNSILEMAEKVTNYMVEGLNKVKFTVPDWVPEIGGKTFGFSLKTVDYKKVELPRLARGAVVPPNREFLAVLGDNKTENEIVAPESRIKEMVKEAMTEFGGFGGGTTVVLEVDGREFGHAVIEQGQRESRRLGTRMVMA